MNLTAHLPTRFGCPRWPHITTSGLSMPVRLHRQRGVHRAAGRAQRGCLLRGGAQRQKVPAGPTISMPVGVAHLLSAAGRRPARCLCITNRAQHSDLEYLP
jgi:hypothetical protein